MRFAVSNASSELSKKPNCEKIWEFSVKSVGTQKFQATINHPNGPILINQKPRRKKIFCANYISEWSAYFDFSQGQCNLIIIKLIFILIINITLQLNPFWINQPWNYWQILWYRKNNNFIPLNILGWIDFWLNVFFQGTLIWLVDYLSRVSLGDLLICWFFLRNFKAKNAKFWNKI